MLPPHIGIEDYDVDLPELNLVSHATTIEGTVNKIMSSSYAFGGNNISIILSRGSQC